VTGPEEAEVVTMVGTETEEALVAGKEVEENRFPNRMLLHPVSKSAHDFAT
jgi:hypothetical protein